MKNKQTDKKSLIVFQDKKIRRIWHDEEWYFSVSDIIAVLTDSKDELAYWRKLKEREPQLVTICHGLKLQAKNRQVYCFKRKLPPFNAKEETKTIATRKNGMIPLTLTQKRENELHPADKSVGIYPYYFFKKFI